MGTECCGKDTAKSSGGSTLAEQKTARAGIQQSSEFAKSLLSAGTGALNQLSGPWDAVMDSSGPATQQITIAYFDDGSLERLQERINESLSGISKLLYGGDKSTGKISGVSHDDGSTTSPLADFSYDSYGRLIETTDHSSSPATTTHYHNDWLTGNMNIADDGSSLAAYNHLPGGSRYTIALIPDEWKQKFLLRGPHGQETSCWVGTSPTPTRE